MSCRFRAVKELIGVLTALNGSGNVEDVNMILDDASAGKLAKVMETGRVTRENQDVFFISISVKKDQAELFTKGQSSMIRDGNRFIMTANPWYPLRFKADLRTILQGSDGLLYAWAVELGNIEFELRDKVPEVDGDSARFENIRAVIYPYGKYQAYILE